MSRERFTIKHDDETLYYDLVNFLRDKGYGDIPDEADDMLSNAATIICQEAERNG